MEKIQYFCDSCGKECLVNEGLVTLAGFIVKMNTELKPERLVFGEHYCSGCAEQVLSFIDHLKNQLKDKVKNKDA